MHVNNETTIPYLIHENCLHIFDPYEAALHILNDTFSRDALIESVSSIKIYVFQHINYYNQATGSMVRYHNATKIVVSNIYTLVELLYTIPRVTCRSIPIVFIVGKDSEFKYPIRQQIIIPFKDWETNTIGFSPFIHHVPQPNPKVIGIQEHYPWDMCYFIENCFNRSHNMTVNLSFNEQEMTVVIKPRDEVLNEWGYILSDDRKLPLVCPFYDGKTPQTDVVTVEDYCKWYDLYIIKKPLSAVKSWDCEIKDFAQSIEWFDHAPKPKSVVENCKRYGMKLDFISYVAICYRWSEDIFNDDTPCESFMSSDNRDEFLPSMRDLLQVLKFNKHSMCTTYGLPWTLDDDITDRIFPGTKNYWSNICNMYKVAYDFGHDIVR